LKEISAYKLLQGNIGIPKLYWGGTEGFFNIIVMELLGPNLQDLFIDCSKHFSLATVLTLAQQMVISFKNLNIA